LPISKNRTGEREEGRWRPCLEPWTGSASCAVSHHLSVAPRRSPPFLPPRLSRCVRCCSWVTRAPCLGDCWVWCGCLSQLEGECSPATTSLSAAHRWSGGRLARRGEGKEKQHSSFKLLVGCRYVLLSRRLHPCLFRCSISGLAGSHEN
jgi:hypothetical protein